LTDIQKMRRDRYAFDFCNPELDARVRRNAARIFAGDYKGNDNGL
jgi:hypothetical protein